MSKRFKKNIIFCLFIVFVFSIFLSVCSYNFVNADYYFTDNEKYVTNQRIIDFNKNNFINKSKQIILNNKNIPDGSNISDSINGFSFRQGARMSILDTGDPSFPFNGLLSYEFNRQFSERSYIDGKRIYGFCLYGINGEKVFPVEYVEITTRKNYGSFPYDRMSYTANECSIMRYSFSDKHYFSVFLPDENSTNVFNNDGLLPKINLYAYLNDYYTSYRIGFYYQDYLFSGTNVFGNQYFYDDTSECYLYSNIRSVYYIAQKMINNPSDMEALNENQRKFIIDMVNEKVEENIDVEYLEVIPNTPFAKKIKRNISVEKLRNEKNISELQIYKALNLSNVNVFDSYVERFVYLESSNSYVADYYTSIVLYGKTPDGKVKDFYLDINKSYSDYFGSMVSAGIIDNDIYEYIFNTGILKKYPELSNYKYNELYGFFSYIVIPDTYSLNSALAFLFDTKEINKGVVYEFHQNSLLSYSNYQKLMTDYDYTHLSTLWNQVVDFTTGSTSNAQSYFLYADPSVSEGGIFQDGSTDKNSSGGVIGTATKNIFTELSSFFGSVWNGLKDNSKIISITLLVVTSIVVLVFVVNLITKNNKNKK